MHARQYSAANRCSLDDNHDTIMTRSMRLLLAAIVGAHCHAAQNDVCVPGDACDHSMHLAVVACGDRLEEPLTMIKSAVAFSRRLLTIHIFADDHLKNDFHTRLESWQKLKWFYFNIQPIQFPPNEAMTWRRLFKTCACQRLFIPDLLPNVDRLLYVDTDVLFLSAIDDLWQHFDRFNATHLAAVASESEDATANWYKRFAKHPFYQPHGINSGVMLMNMRRMRKRNWTSRMLPTLRKYERNITWGDQDILNILFAQNPGWVYLIDCCNNFRPDHCMYSHNCKSAIANGVRVLHGSRGYFHSDKQPVFKAIYSIFAQYTIGDDITTSLVTPIRRAMTSLRKQNWRCAIKDDIFITSLLTI